MDTTNDKKTWNVAVLSIYWRADRHQELHSIEFERPRKDNPEPQYPVVVGEVLSKDRLPQSSSWCHLFARIVVKAFDEHALTVQYGQREITVRPGEPSTTLDESGMDYTSFELNLGVKDVAPENASLRVTHDERFLRRFRNRDRVMRLTDDDVEMLRKVAEKGDAYAQYGLGRWLYYYMPTDTAIREAEELFLAAKKYVPDALAAYAMMWRYGETKENMMDLEESQKLLQDALKRGSEKAAHQLARARLFGIFCEAEPEKVAHEIEQLLDKSEDYDPIWNSLLAYAYEQLDRKDDAFKQYELATAKGQTDDYFYMAYLYKQRGNVALHDSLIEKGILEGSGLCCTFGADMDEDDFKELSDYQRRQHHDEVEANLHIGLKRGEGWCAYYLWYLTYYKELAFNGDAALWSGYLKQGIRFANTTCMMKVAELAEDGEWPEEMSPYEIGELWLRAARYNPDDENALWGLRRVSDPVFLLHHKEELERYWQPKFKEVQNAPESSQTSPESENTGIPEENDKLHEPMVIVIWPSGHMDLPAVDVAKMKSYREMAQELIRAESLDAVHYSPLLHKVAEAAGLKQDLVMYCDRDAQMKDLPDNSIGTQLYGQDHEVRGAIIVCLQDQMHDPQSFRTTHDLVGTYREINNHCGGLIICQDEDDGRFDAWA
jgi:hypothetical protein